MIIEDNLIGEALPNGALAGMFEARKQIFVDLLKWDLPVLAGRFEIDQFDDEHARYLIVADEAGRHLGSARLLPTTRPHILGTLFASLSAAPVPAGPHINEITRFCLGRNQNAAQRLNTRNRLVSALVRYAIDHDIRCYTGVAELGWLQQILAFGWNCRPLGIAQRVGGSLLGALAIDIDGKTPALLHRNGIWVEEDLASSRTLEAA